MIIKKGNAFVQLADGTAGAPSLTFGSDPDTGAYSSGANQFSITIGGTQHTRFTGTTTTTLRLMGATAAVLDNNAGGLSINPAGTLTVGSGGSSTGVATFTNGTLMRIGANNAHSTAGTNIISIATGTAPSGAITSMGSFYAATATNVEINWIDSAGNAQQLSTT